MKSINTKIILVAVVVLAVLACAFAIWKLHTPASAPLSITTTTGNYGLFINNQDNEYFSTHDANVRNIIKAYLSDLYINPKTDAEKYGNKLVYYYTKDNFIVAGLYYWANLNNIDAFAMYDMKTGKPMSSCLIYAQAGLYRDPDLLLSASFTDNGVDMKQGVCFYNRGAPNFTFVDLTPQLAKNETLFDDPAGRNLHASLRKVDNDQSVIVDVYDTSKVDVKGNYAYKRIIKVGYEITPTRLGIQDPIDQTILGQGFVLGTNSWKGYIDGKLTAVTGTAEYDNPSQGVVFVWEPDNGIGTTRSYPSPTATGPLKIISQQNDVLVLQSVAGTYEVSNDDTSTRKSVTTNGGETYTFDIRGRKFVQ